MARPKKVLTQGDINRNSSIKISHTISKIKANERKHTVCLVIIFLFLFCVIGFFTLRVNVSKLEKDYNESAHKTISIKSRVVTLTEDNYYTKLDDLDKSLYEVTISNGLNKKVNYKVKLIKDDYLYNLCECDESKFNVNNVRFSLDKKNGLEFSSIDDMVIDIGQLKKDEEKTLNVYLWYSKKEENSHFHGRFIIEAD